MPKLVEETKSAKYEINRANAKAVLNWLRTRGGVLIWQSIDLGDIGKRWTTPATDADGNPVVKPHWQCANEPAQHITGAADVVVYTSKVVKRFHVAVEAREFHYVVTDAGTRRIRREVEKAKAKYGKPAWYEFDYGDYENALIVVEDSRVSLEYLIAELDAEGKA